MNKKWIIALSVFSQTSFGSTPSSTLPEVKKLLCKESVQNTIQSWESKGKWRRAIDSSPGGRTYRSPTQTLGVWLELRSDENGVPEAYRIAEDSILQVGWDSKSCEPRIKMNPIQRAQSNSFTDRNLKTLLQSGKPGAIYVWYPGFDFSYASYPAFEKAARARNLDVTVVLGAEAPPEYVKRRNADYKLNLNDQRLQSVELLARDVNHHFPNVILYGNGAIARKTAIGALTEPMYAQYFDETLASLKKGQAE